MTNFHLLLNSIKSIHQQLQDSAAKAVNKLLTIRNQQYVMTYHARKEMNEDALLIYDVEQCILTGKVLERQKDRMTGDWKYRIRGNTLGGDEIEVIVKLGPTDKLVIITVYKLEEGNSNGM